MSEPLYVIVYRAPDGEQHAGHCQRDWRATLVTVRHMLRRPSAELSKPVRVERVDA